MLTNSLSFNPIKTSCLPYKSLNRILLPINISPKRFSFQGNPGSFQGNPGSFQGNPGSFLGNQGSFQGLLRCFPTRDKLPKHFSSNINFHAHCFSTQRNISLAFSSVISLSCACLWGEISPVQFSIKKNLASAIFYQEKSSLFSSQTILATLSSERNLYAFYESCDRKNTYHLATSN